MHQDPAFCLDDQGAQPEKEVTARRRVSVLTLDSSEYYVAATCFLTFNFLLSSSHSWREPVKCSASAKVDTTILTAGLESPTCRRVTSAVFRGYQQRSNIARGIIRTMLQATLGPSGRCSKKEKKSATFHQSYNVAEILEANGAVRRSFVMASGRNLIIEGKPYKPLL